VRYTRIRVVGPSMEPALRNGDWWVVRRTTQVNVGDVILLVHPLRPGLLVVKRAIRREGTAWWVEGDCPALSEDSRQFGPVPASAIVGRLAWRYHPLRRADLSG
jgi:nickel-type superoxide dismutase maturation protease